MSGFISYRFFQAYGLLEYRLNNMTLSEEAALTGAWIASMIFQGIPQGGSSVSFTLTQTGMTTQTITYTVQPNDNLLTIAQGIVNLILNNPTLVGANFQAVSPLGIGAFAQPTPILAPPNQTNSGLLFGTPGFAITNSVASFTMSLPTISNVSGSTLGAYVEANGNYQIPPVSTVDPTTNPPTILHGYIPILDYLEGAVAGATQNLDTEKADVWSARMTELEERSVLYRHWQLKLADFIGVPLNDTSRAGIITMGPGSNSWGIY